jgi:hypothetical protein
VASSLPVSLPAITLPKGVVASSTGLQTAVTCPTGYTAVGGVCSPTAVSTTSNIISGVPNWVIYVGVGLLAFMTMSSSTGKR